MNRVALLLQTDLFRWLRSYFERLGRSESGLWGVAIELLLIGLVVYALLKFLQGTRGARLLQSLGVILIGSFMVVRLVAEKLALERIIYLYPFFVGGVVLITLVAFQPEIRRGLVRMGDARWLRSWSKDTERIIDPLVTAAASLSLKKIGALIAIQRQVGIEGLAESGVRVGAEVTAELLETIFWPGSALHDMGVIIRRSRLAAARCQFPIAESGDLDPSLGSRHRAAIGLSLESDALVLVVSEETGTISVAEAGRLHRPLSSNGLRELLTAGLTGEQAEGTTEGTARQKVRTPSTSPGGGGATVTAAQPKAES
jgi:diadenylate cyclase